MKRALAIALILVVLRSDAAGIWAPDVWNTNVWDDKLWGAQLDPPEPTTVVVPNVVGQVDFAAADAILEGDGLDGNELAAACSAEDEDVIIRQSPAAGTEVALGTVINLTPSSGVACPSGGGAEIILRRRR